ncbi:hypothetical protein G6F56_002988 [Rhizopus delemar]|nr:hypothetical protein G6F56_002988 [Rhizopus delemar]
MSSFPITQLTEPNSSFTLSPSFNNKIFLKEEKKLSEYKKGIIEFWNVDERLEKPKAYWQTVFEIKPIEQQHQSYFRKMCIYTKKPLPKIPKFDCHFEGIGFEIHLYHATNPIYLKEEDSQLLLDYTLEVTAKLTNKSFHCTKQQTPYLIAPLESMLHHSAFQETIDWLELRKTVTNVVKRVPENAGHLRDAILLDPMDVTKLYFTKELPERGTQRQNDLMDVYPIKGKGNTVKQINPGLCRVYPMSASVYQTIQILPEILLQMDEFLLIQQFKKKHAFNYIDDTILLEAFTSPSSGKSKNYERLEFLGDLYQYIISGVTPRRFWRPPNFQCTSDESKKAKQWLTYHSIANNTLADAMESALGAAFLSGSLNGVVRAIRQFDIPMGIKTWTDIHAIYQLSPKSTLISWQIDLVSVSEILGYTFKDNSLLQEALMHRSASNGTYERLEFLGDALLDYYVTTYIYQGHPTATPSILHSLRKSSVNHHILSVICLKMKLHKHIVYSAGSIAAAVMKFEYDHQRVVDSGEDVDEYWLALDPPKMLSDVVESLLGAMLVDSGFDVNRVQVFFNRWIKPVLDQHVSLGTMREHPMSLFTKKIQELGCMNWITE